MDPIKIIGAGPAGLTAAIVLRRRGVPVTVYEKAPEVGHRLSGDFQGLENWSSDIDITTTLRDMGVEVNFLCQPFRGGVIHTRGMDPVEVGSEKPIFYLVRRGPMPGTLDAGLKEQALGLGAEIHFNSGVDNLAGPAIVGTGPRGADVIAVGITFDTPDEDSAEVIVDNDIAPGGYAYLLICNGRGTMATVLYRDYRNHEECFSRMVRHFDARREFTRTDETRFGGFGNFFLWDTQVRHGKLYVGESAGFQDCLWGFGMRYSIISGYLAARSILDGIDYDGLWKREIGPMLEASLINRYLFDRCGHSGYRFLTRKLAGGDPCRFLQRHYNRLPVKHLLLPLARRHFTNRVRDYSCSHENCTCVWCRCEKPKRSAL